MLKNYYYLAKPGIIYGNVLTTTAGFFLASKSNINLKLLAITLIGLSLIIASGCVCNNLLDARIDALMQRTKNRALASGKISRRSAVIFGSILLILGFVALHHHTNTIALFVAFLGFVVYVFLYTPLKRRSTYATLIGSISGATPPVVGYTAISNHIDAGAIILFLTLVFWQMPHFYAIAIYRLGDYTSALIPVLPAKKGIYITKIHMILYIIAFTITTLMLTIFGYTGYTYFIIAGLLGASWLWYCIKGFSARNDDTRWARTMFMFSLVIIMALSITILVDGLLKTRI